MVEKNEAFKALHKYYSTRSQNPLEETGYQVVEVEILRLSEKTGENITLYWELTL
jgi:hypothetical protein